MDKMNLAILAQLTANSRKSWQDIGRHVHLTGQAVAARVEQMRISGIIRQFTIRRGDVLRYFVLVYMNSNAFAEFERTLHKLPAVVYAYKTAGDACYMLEVESDDATQLDELLTPLLAYGRYQILTVMKMIK